MKYKLSNNIKENKMFKIGVIKSLLLILFLLNFFSIYAQTNQDTLVFLRVKYKNALAIHEGESINPNGISGPNYTKNSSLNSLLTSYGVIYYAPFYPKDDLNLNWKNYYGLSFNGNAEDFIADLSELGLTNDIEILEHAKPLCSNPVVINDANVVNGWSNNDAINLINARCAWTITKGNPDLRVAIADSDFELTHSDLTNRIREAYGQLTFQDPHGTQVLGVAGAEPNTIGMVGAGYNLKWDVSRFGPNWAGSSITNAANKGARVINFSYSSTDYSVADMQALVDRGIVVVVAAGNDTTNKFNYDIGLIPGVIRISGVDKFGNHGPTGHAHDDRVELCAMSKNVTVTNNGNSYVNGIGTSFAAPQVSATAGLILSLNPCFTPAQVEYIIKSTTKPILDASSFPGLVGSGYLDMYEALKFAAGRSSMTLTTSQVWTKEEIINGNIIVPAGITLTIKGKVSCYPNAAFTVKAGGKLIIDGGILSGLCDLWKGIRVEGTSNQNQSLANVGFLEVKNKAIISDAQNAVSLTGIDNNGNTDLSKSGGLVIASGESQFLNNKRDVEFLSYHPKNIYGEEVSNYSSFNNCSFIVNTNRKFLLTDGDCSVTMWDVNGVRFSGCSFVNNSFVYKGFKNAKTGIYAISSSFKVGSFCTNNNQVPCPSSIKSKFIGLNTGIKSDGDGTLGIISIENSEFDSYYGVFLQGTNGSMVRSNKFRIEHVDIKDNDGNIIVQRTDYPCGAYLDKCQRFNTEGNEFNGAKVWYGSPNDLPKFDKHGAAGLVIRNTGANNNEFYRSKFNNLKIASQTLGDNKNKTTGGLEFICNDYKECWDDLHVLNSNNTYSINFSGIKQDQWRFDNIGNIMLPKNQFTNNNMVLNNTIENNIVSGINYAYFGSNNIGNRYYPSNNFGTVYTKQYANLNEICPIRLIDYGIGREQMGIKLGVLLPILTQKNTEFNALVDNGNTESLKNNISNANAGNVVNLVNQLLAYSPYLSDEILALIAQQNAPFTNEMIRDLLLANPHSSRNPFVLEKLASRTNKLSDVYIDQINNKINVFTNYDNLKNVLSAITTDYDFTLHELLYSYESDTNAIISDYATWMKHPSNPTYHYQLAEKLFNKGDLNNYLKVVDSIPLIIKFSNKQTLYHNAFTELYQKLYDWKQSGLYLYKPNAAIKDWLLNFAQNHNEYPSCVHSLLAVNDTLISKADVYMPIGNLEGAKYVKLNTTSLEKENKESQINLYPNPAKDIIILEWKSNAKPSYITVTDLQGKTVMQKQWNMEEKGILLTQNWANGIYFVKIISDDNEENIVRKVIINK